MLHKFWRLHVAATSSAYFQVSEVAFLDSAGADVSVGGVASAGSEYDSTYSAGKAFDKSHGTDYCSAADVFPAFLQYACPSAVEVTSVRFRWATNNLWLPKSMAHMVLASSPDGVTWADFYTLSLTSGSLTAGAEAVASATAAGPLLAGPTGGTLPVFCGPSSEPLASVAMGSAAAVRDAEFGGAGRIWGTTKTKGTPNQPTKARVVLLHQRSKLPVRETWSDPVTGAFAFTGIDTTQQFLTLAEDAAGNFRPVAANRLTPEVLA